MTNWWPRIFEAELFARYKFVAGRTAYINNKFYAAGSPFTFGYATGWPGVYHRPYYYNNNLDLQTI